MAVEKTSRGGDHAASVGTRPYCDDETVYQSYRSGCRMDRRGAGMRIRNDHAAGLPEPRSSSVFETNELLERHRRESLRKTSERRAAKRRSERAVKQGKARFIALALTLLTTAVIVSIVLFRALYLVLE